jgi:hypothetical protein
MQERLQVTVADGEYFEKSAAGASPLELDLGEVVAGTYAVHIFFDGPVGAMPDQAISWEVAGEVRA